MSVSFTSPPYEPSCHLLPPMDPAVTCHLRSTGPAGATLWSKAVIVAMLLPPPGLHLSLKAATPAELLHSGGRPTHQSSHAGRPR